jgi:hypothetical protein
MTANIGIILFRAVRPGNPRLPNRVQGCLVVHPSHWHLFAMLQVRSTKLFSAFPSRKYNYEICCGTSWAEAWLVCGVVPGNEAAHSHQQFERTVSPTAKGTRSPIQNGVWSRSAT